MSEPFVLETWVLHLMGLKPPLHLFYIMGVRQSWWGEVEKRRIQLFSGCDISAVGTDLTLFASLIILLILSAPINLQSQAMVALAASISPCSPALDRIS
jgi:hypothetical protein